ncbi:MAG TPA: DUF6220 domain-containing protein [Candidatus Limnocylindria bacterium]|nr:DUF6220 domain-containing protein [Candidatus Limnocylindria bacterium]
MQALRYALAAVAVLFVLAVLLQVYLAGSALFAAGSWQTHVDVGYTVAIVPVLLSILAFVARAGRTTIWLAVATLVVTQVQTFLPLFRDAAPWLAAVHPVNAMLVFGLAVLVAWRAVALARADSAVVATGP